MSDKLPIPRPEPVALTQEQADQLLANSGGCPACAAKDARIAELETELGGTITALDAARDRAEKAEGFVAERERERDEARSEWDAAVRDLRAEIEDRDVRAKASREATARAERAERDLAAARRRRR